MARFDTQSSWYEDYLRGDHWQEIRQRKLEAAGFQCERCGFFGDRHPGSLHVHHLSYARVHAEELDDLQVLCEWCHQGEHGFRRHPTRERWKASLIDRRVVPRLVDYRDDIDVEIAAWDGLAAEAGF